MNCTVCGDPVVAGDAYCGVCGTRIAEPHPVCAVCQAPVAAGAHFCTSCGAALDGASAARAVEPDSVPDSVPVPVPVPVHHVAPAAAVPPPAAASPPPPLHTAASAPPTASGFAFTNPVSLIAAVVAIVGSLLAWFDFRGVTTNAFDIAAPFLVDHQTTASDTVTVGVLVVLLGAAAAVVCLVPAFGARQGLLRGLGFGMIAIAGSFAFQMAQTANDLGLSFGDIIGIGPFVTGVGGIALLSGR